jgi:hypothetical protein
MVVTEGKKEKNRVVSGQPPIMNTTIRKVS